jgi:hypothetical protein
MRRWHAAVLPSRLEKWLNSLERLYVILALQVAEYEGSHEPGSIHPLPGS